MKTLTLSLFLVFLPFWAYSQVCSANAGGDQAICVGDQLFLYGEDSDLYQDPLEAHWTSLSNPPSRSLTRMRCKPKCCHRPVAAILLPAIMISSFA